MDAVGSVRTLEVGPLKIRVACVCRAKGGALQHHAPHIRAREIGAAEIGASHIGSTQVHSRQVDPGERETLEIAVRLQEMMDPRETLRGAAPQRMRRSHTISESQRIDDQEECAACRCEPDS
jgi:hypothetical protein